MRFLLIYLLLVWSVDFSLLAQTPQPPFTTATERLKGTTQRQMLRTNSLLNQVPFHSVGPTVFGGRITDLAVNPNDPTVFYAAYASGGLWKTESNGTRFIPLFDDEAVITIGDIAVDWERDIIWIGTGENNSSRSSYSGVGLYQSTDGGKTWNHRGLPESHHIGRIILHPSDSNTLWVAALGHLYSPNPERGVYKTTDGGQTWELTLFVDENSGAIDLVIDPDNPDILYASTWHRERRAWNFIESGEGSLIHGSTDGGQTWSTLTIPGSGFPTSSDMGRIGLAITKKNNNTRLYAIVDNYSRRPPDAQKAKDKKLTKEMFRDMTRDEFLKIEPNRIEQFLKDNNFPQKYSLQEVQQMVTDNKIKPSAFVEYLENANSLLFDTPVIGAEVYVSDDLGKNWKKTHDGYLDNVYNSYGYYFGQIHVSPLDPEKIYIYGVPILRSSDGGKTFKNINGDNVHVDHHSLWISDQRPGHLILGNDGGVNISYDDGDSWYKCNTVAAGQFYAVAVDNEKPYNIYGGLQDNGVWVGSSKYQQNDRWHNSGRYPYQILLGGDGMQIAVDPRDHNVLYTGYQYGFYFRINRATNEQKLIQPRHELGERPYRWNWQTPIHLSTHNPDILYLGGNHLFRSMDQGDHFKKISKDLTKGGREGDVAFGTITTIHESSLVFGLLYVGTDDGLVHVSRDGGHSWNKITRGLPADQWVTKIQASAHVEGTVYASLNGYRYDDFTPYLYQSTDYGNTWQRIGLDLPLEPINVIKEDPENQDILYVGTDHGLYVSVDQGVGFMEMRGTMPAVAVHDVVVHPRDNDLIVGTHGRSIYIAPVGELQALNVDVLSKTIHLFEIEEQYYNSRWGTANDMWSDTIKSDFTIPVYAKTAGKAVIGVKLENGQLLKKMTAKLARGLNYVAYDFSIMDDAVKKYEAHLNKDLKKGAEKIKLTIKKDGQIYLHPGSYELEVTKDGSSDRGAVILK